ncbi:MAG: hypothetical protein GC129_01440 [Proteobacteria bacterium]|nr:hypothetical protein [Pseudomonadota bacterium]
MKKRPIPPFYENIGDGHCVQAVLRSVLEHFEPDIRLNWADMDKFTAKYPGKWAWNQRSLINFYKRGYTMVGFSREPEKVSFMDLYQKYGLEEALLQSFGEEAGKIQLHHCHRPSVEKALREYLRLRKSGKLDIPFHQSSVKAIKEYIKKGFLVSVALNSRKLNRRKGYSGHRVLVYDFNTKGPIFHDPGEPGTPARHVSWKHFAAACTSPTPRQWQMMAYKKEKPHA